MLQASVEFFGCTVGIIICTQASLPLVLCIFHYFLLQFQLNLLLGEGFRVEGTISEVSIIYCEPKRCFKKSVLSNSQLFYCRKVHQSVIHHVARKSDPLMHESKGLSVPSLIGWGRVRVKTWS